MSWKVNSSNTHMESILLPNIPEKNPKHLLPSLLG